MSETDTLMDPLDLVVLYAMSFVKTPYVYGDKSPVLGGFDCSGFVCEVLRFAGLVGNKEVLNAQNLYDKFHPTGSDGVFSRGALAFYGKSVTDISHVALMVNQYQILEAGGGDSDTDSSEKADLRNAMVRGRLVKYRSDFITTVKPNYSSIGFI